MPANFRLHAFQIMDPLAQSVASSPRPWGLLAGWALLFVLAIVAYLPGLSGPFLFDDFGTLAELGQRGGIRDWETFRAFVFGGHAGPTGRPLALLTFLLDATNWPADAWPFKRTNVVIHVINGALLGYVTSQILRVLDFKRDDVRWIAVVAAGCWLLHPFLVSTTLYVVQRMAQLSTLFVFAGLAGHLYGRSMLAERPRRAYVFMTMSIGLFTLLAMLSKENGILLPLLIGTMEVTVFAAARQRAATLSRYWVAVCLVLPSLIIVAYLAMVGIRSSFFEAVPPRDFSIYERLLTQGRILVDYLQHWFIPDVYTTGVFQDHFEKSTGFFEPATTLLGITFHGILIAMAIRMRSRLPLIAFAVLFYYGSHLIESTVISLELYFEHRNYTAAAFLFLPAVAALRTKTRRSLFVLVSVLVLLMLAGFTRYSATIWADYASIVEASATKAPTSARAQAQYATLLYNAGRFDEAAGVLDTGVAKLPHDISLQLSRGIILCNIGILTRDDFRELGKVLSSRAYDPRSIRLYTQLNESVIAGRCPAISADALKAMYVSMLDVPDNADQRSLRYSQIQYFIGYSEVHLRDAENAEQAFRLSLASRPGASHAMMMAAVFASNGYLEQALEFSALALAELDNEEPGLMDGARVGRADILAFREGVAKELAERVDGAPP